MPTVASFGTKLVAVMPGTVISLQNITLAVFIQHNIYASTPKLIGVFPTRVTA